MTTVRKFDGGSRTRERGRWALACLVLAFALAAGVGTIDTRTGQLEASMRSRLADYSQMTTGHARIASVRCQPVRSNQTFCTVGTRTGTDGHVTLTGGPVALSGRRWAWFEQDGGTGVYRGQIG